MLMYQQPQTNPFGNLEGQVQVFSLSIRRFSRPKHYIKAVMLHSHSIIMAEAVALALAATLMINFDNVSFLSKCSQLVDFINKDEHENPPDWRIKEYTQNFKNCTLYRNARAYNSRTLNTNADVFARQASGSPVQPWQEMTIICSVCAYDIRCPIIVH